MKVAKITPGRLVIEDRPWFMWLTLPVMGVAAVGTALLGQFETWGETLLVLALGVGALWIVWKFSPFQRIIFDRTSGTFTHIVRRLTGTQTWERPLSDIERAADEPNWSDGARLERVTLLTTDGPYPLESGFTGLSRDSVIDTINEWLESE